MADNATLNAGSGGVTLAMDDIGGVHHQRVKIEIGADGAASDVSSANPMPVGDAAGSLTVDAPVGTPVFVRLSDGSAAIATLPVSAAALPLPSGAATEAKQDTQIAHEAAIRTAVETLDNAIAGSEMQVDVVGALPSGTNAIGKLAANSGVDIGDVDVTSIAAGDNNIGNVDIVTVPTDPFGANADAASATGSISAKLRFIAATGIPITGTVTVGSHAVTNAGTFATQVDGAALTALQLIDDPVKVDDAGFTPGTSSVMMAGFEADEGSTDSVDEGDAGAARMTLDRKLITNPQPHTAGGLSIFRSLDLDETEEEVKASAGQVYGWYIANLRTTPLFLKFYNATAANVSVGSTTPVMTLPIPANSTNYVAGHMSGTHGIAFDTAITVAATTGVADADTGAPAANECVVNIWYK